MIIVFYLRQGPSGARDVPYSLVPRRGVGVSSPGERSTASFFSSFFLFFFHSYAKQVDRKYPGIVQCEEGCYHQQQLAHKYDRI